MPLPHDPALLHAADARITPGETAAILQVDTKTLIRWERLGRLVSVRTLGGHRRFTKDSACTWRGTEIPLMRS
ncbi:MerR family DNA-binding transcriptional regulator [Nocardiopsis synnemataformans]|uniref:MerR family DNA-binding transcriptional regulator n=1 Tax=Nocardiopsis synnemataformans TaxID=61305 RepID=UPI003EB7BC38